MPHKNFSIYSAQNFNVDMTDQLVLEAGKSHIACICIKENKTITAFELFTFNENETANFRHLFASILATSKLLDKFYAATHIYINNEVSLLVPVYKFNKEIAADYLNVVFGEDTLSKVQFDHLSAEPQMMNVYRIKEDIFTVLNRNLTKINYKHTYSNIVKTLLQNIAAFPDEFIFIQFYNTSFIVVVMINGKLTLIQSFVYETPEDVLYYLLNLTHSLELYNDNLTLQISGMIDLDFQLYRELIKYFRQVNVENISALPLLPEAAKHPLHYFTPFFNLAL